MGVFEEIAKDLKDGVFIGIRNCEYPSQFLIVKHKYGNKRWNLPGGGIKQAELVPFAAIRESLEEANIHITRLRPVGREFTLRKKYGLVVIFAALEWEGLPIIGPDNPEIEATRFVGMQEAKILYENQELEPAQYSILLILEEYWDKPDANIYGYLTVPPTIITL